MYIVPFAKKAGNAPAVYRTEIGLGDIPAGTKFFFHDYSKWPMERG